jgi:hypothetical protein
MERDAILVRPVGDCFQILDGHPRVTAAEHAGLEAWVREYSDEEAFPEMALANAHTGLAAGERAGSRELKSGAPYGN